MVAFRQRLYSIGWKRMNASRFFDTNVLLYLLSGDQAKANAAETLVASGGIVSVQVLNEFASVATRKLHMLIPEVREILATVRRLCTVHSLSVESHDEGLEVADRYQLSVYDAMIVASAHQAGCKSLYTEDLQDGMAILGLTIRNPFNA
ncbi:MAG: PIN domain-containing protein [Candidatus Velthaea sp.]